MSNRFSVLLLDCIIIFDYIWEVAQYLSRVHSPYSPPFWGSAAALTNRPRRGCLRFLYERGNRYVCECVYEVLFTPFWNGKSDNLIATNDFEMQTC